MSAGSPTFDLAPDVAAALLWDVPRLRATDDGETLEQAFGPPPWPEPPWPATDDDENASLLRVAAQGVLAHQQDSPDRAAGAWKALAARGFNGKVLGLSLELWANPTDRPVAQTVAELHELVSHISSQDTRARLLRRVALHASEHNVRAVQEACVHEALAVVEDGTHLAASLQMMAVPLGITTKFPERPRVDDPLISQPWIRELGYTAVAQRDLTSFEDSLMGAWSFVFRGGRRPIDMLVAAQGQADWSGALGLRDELRRLMAAQMLRGDVPTTPGEAVWAAEAWVLAGGKHPVRILQRIGRHLDGESGTALLRRLLEPSDRPFSVAELGQGLWDIVDDEGVDLLLRETDPGVASDVTRAAARRVWGNLLWRSPGAFMGAWARLPPDRKVGALGEVNVGVVDHLDAATAGTLVAALTSSPPGRARTLVMALALVAGASRPEAHESDLSPSDVAELLTWRQGSVTPKTVERAISRTHAIVDSIREDVLAGQIPMGGQDPRALLGLLSAHSRLRVAETIALLRAVATDDRMPSEHQLGALDGLWHFVAEELIAPEIADDIARWPETGQARTSAINLDAIGMRAARLRLAAARLTPVELQELVAACRADRVETRLLALGAVVAHARVEAGPIAVTVLYGALYDPADEVTIQALNAVAGNILATDHGTTVAARAIRGAFDRGTVSVRRAAVRAARAYRTDETARGVLGDAAEDPSWVVRREAERGFAD